MYKEIPQPIPDKVFREFCTRMGIGVYDEDEEEEEQDFAGALDLDAFDLYWEDIRIERNTLFRELRHLPLKHVICRKKRYTILSIVFLIRKITRTAQQIGLYFF